MWHRAIGAAKQGRKTVSKKQTKQLVGVGEEGASSSRQRWEGSGGSSADRGSNGEGQSLAQGVAQRGWVEGLVVAGRSGSGVEGWNRLRQLLQQKSKSSSSTPSLPLSSSSSPSLLQSSKSSKLSTSLQSQSPSSPSSSSSLVKPSVSSTIAAMHPPPSLSHHAFHSSRSLLLLNPSAFSSATRLTSPLPPSSWPRLLGVLSRPQNRHQSTVALSPSAAAAAAHGSLLPWGRAGAEGGQQQREAGGPGGAGGVRGNPTAAVALAPSAAVQTSISGIDLASLQLYCLLCEALSQGDTWQQQSAAEDVARRLDALRRGEEMWGGEERRRRGGREGMGRGVEREGRGLTREMSGGAASVEVSENDFEWEMFLTKGMDAVRAWNLPEQEEEGEVEEEVQVVSEREEEEEEEELSLEDEMREVEMMGLQNQGSGSSWNAAASNSSGGGGGGSSGLKDGSSWQQQVTFRCRNMKQLVMEAEKELKELWGDEEVQRNLERQRRMEEEAMDRALEEYKATQKELMMKGMGASLRAGQRLMLHWLGPLTAMVERVQKGEEVVFEGRKIVAAGDAMGRTLQLLSAEKLAIITLHKLVGALMAEETRYATGTMGNADIARTSEKGYMTFVRTVVAAQAVGRTVEQAVKLDKAKAAVRWRKKQRAAEAAAAAEAAGAGVKKGSRGKAGKKKNKKEKASEVVAAEEQPESMVGESMLAGRVAQQFEEWPQEVALQIGSLLLDLLMATAHVPDDFWKRVTVEESKGKKVRGKRQKKTSKQSPKDDELVAAAAVAAAAAEAVGGEGSEEAAAKGGVPEMAFLRDYVKARHHKTYGAISCHPAICKAITRESRDHISDLPYMPMIVPPRRWRRFNSGAYLSLPSTVVRLHGSHMQRRKLAETPYEQMAQVYKALDVLGSTAWKVNHRVASVLQQIWSRGGGYAGLVTRHDDPVPPPLPPGASDEEVKAWRKEVKQVKKVNAERHSLRADMELKLSVVQRYWQEPRFFYPHSMDFRGRAYPMHPHLNHLGADASRGLLHFAEGRPLGPAGLRWLKVHLANLVGGGVDKLSFDERERFVDEHMKEIRESVADPMRGRTQAWWAKAEDPFQCLAACFEIVAATDSQHPEEFISHLPVHADGSCNGLQHYAALGRDTDGAYSVNMMPIERPADVYSGIADIVRDTVAKEAADTLPSLSSPSLSSCLPLSPFDHDWLASDLDVPTTQVASPTAAAARLLKDHVDRKLVKQTVMTSVYGVTFIGARDQIRNRIREKEISGEDRELMMASNYAARVTLDALSQMFSSARQIMAWLANCARLISAKDNSVEWTTPLGLPILQPYVKARRKVVRTSMQYMVVYEEGRTNKIEKARQRSAFPPNFVHSLDSSHMMRTALACHERGLTFAGVHDSFWTHAGTVDEMNRILRKEFVELHSQPILENLLEEFRMRYPDIDFPDVPKRGDFDLKQVLDAPYFFD